MYKVLVFSLVLIGCSNTQPSRYVNSSSVELSVYVQDFENRYNLSVGLPVYIGDDLNANTVAVCRIWVDGYREVQFNRLFYNQYKQDYYFMQQIIYHELGHCVFNLGHDETIENNRPKSIMYPYAFGNTPEYKNNLYSYYNELYYKGTGLVGINFAYKDFIDVH